MKHGNEENELQKSNAPEQVGSSDLLSTLEQTACCSILKDHQIADLVNELNYALGADLVRCWNDMYRDSDTPPIYSRSDARKAISRTVTKWVKDNKF